MRRNLLGIVALACLLAGIALYLLHGGDSRNLEWTSACLRVGALLGAVWLALPDLRRPGNRSYAMTALAGFVLLAWRPRLVVFAIGFFALAWLLRPRKSVAGEPPRR